MMLETPRLILRPMTRGDGVKLLPIFRDPQVLHAWGRWGRFDRRQMAERVERNLKHQARYGYGVFCVVERHTGLLIGECGLEREDTETLTVAYLDCHLRSEVWNRRYATEAAFAVRDYAFETAELNELVSLIHMSSVARRRVAEKIGMTLTRTFDTGMDIYEEMRLRRSDQASPERQSP